MRSMNCCAFSTDTSAILTSIDQQYRLPGLHVEHGDGFDRQQQGRKADDASQEWPDDRADSGQGIMVTGDIACEEARRLKSAATACQHHSRPVRLTVCRA